MSFLKKTGVFFVPYQSGFRLDWSTMDSVLMLDLDLKKALVNKEAVVAVFLDIEEAYGHIVE